MQNRSWMLGFFLLILSGVGFSTQSAQATMWGVVTTKNTKSTNAYGSPTQGAEVIGTYAYGTVLRVFITPQNGFYAVPIMQENREPYYVYVSQEDVIPTSADAAVSRTIASVSKPLLDRFLEISPQVDYLSMNYKPGNGVNFTSTLVRAGLGLTYYRTDDHLELGLYSSYAAMNVSTSIKGVGAHQLFGNVRAGYITHLGSLGVGLFAGLSVNQLVFTGASYGFQTLYYPEIYPRFELKLSNKMGARLTTKLIPLSAIDKLNQRQVYARLDLVYKYSLASSSFWSVGLEYSDLLIRQYSGLSSRLTSEAFSVGFNLDF